MSDAKPAPSEIITELNTSAHLMRLDPGVYAVFHAEGSSPPDVATGLPAARMSLPPGQHGTETVLSGFGPEGWIAFDGASLIRIVRGPAQVLMTVYQMPGSPVAPPRLQVRRLVEGTTVAPQVATSAAAGGQETVTGGAKDADPIEPEIAAHVQARGDVLARIGDWIGDRGSQRWVEGFAVSPRHVVAPEDLEYQAVLGRGWLSPWSEGGKYCGSRGMALPILGLRARLRGAAAATHRLELQATFTDGTAIGPVGDGEACEAESLAPLEAFQLTFHPVTANAEPVAAKAGKARAGKAIPVKPAAKLLAKPAVVKSLAAKPVPEPTASLKSVSSKTGPAKTSPIKAGPAKTSSIKVGSAKTEPAKSSPAKTAAKTLTAKSKGGGR